MHSERIKEFLKYASPRLEYIEHCMEKQALSSAKTLGHMVKLIRSGRLAEAGKFNAAKRLLEKNQLSVENLDEKLLEIALDNRYKVLNHKTPRYTINTANSYGELGPRLTENSGLPVEVSRFRMQRGTGNTAQDFESTWQNTLGGVIPNTGTVTGDIPTAKLIFQPQRVGKSLVLPKKHIYGTPRTTASNPNVLTWNMSSKSNAASKTKNAPKADSNPKSKNAPKEDADNAKGWLDDFSKGVGDWAKEHPVLTPAIAAGVTTPIAGGIGYGIGHDSGFESGSSNAAAYWQMREALRNHQLRGVNSEFLTRLANLFGGGDLSRLIG